MVEKFKEYLVEQFRQIAPTRAAMEYRKRVLKQLLDRAQELKIKGIDDENLIYNMCIDELGDFSETLKDFENQEIKTEKGKRTAKLGTVIGITCALMLVVIYLIIGGVTNIWHPTWLLLVGGAFVGITILSNLLVFKPKKKNVVLIRFVMAISLTLFLVFVFLMLQLVFNLNGSWQAFLVLPVLLLGVDTIIAFLTNSKVKWFELPILIEVLFVMLYVLIGLNLPGFWHPGWILCLVGVAAAFIELSIFIALKNKKDDVKESKKINNKYIKEDEKYYTSWDD